VATAARWQRRDRTPSGSHRPHLVAIRPDTERAPGEATGRVEAAAGAAKPTGKSRRDERRLAVALLAAAAGLLLALALALALLGVSVLAPSLASHSTPVSKEPPAREGAAYPPDWCCAVMP
jgi:hypothetical protein